MQREKSYELRLADDFLSAFVDRSFSADGFVRETLTNAWEADAPRVDVTISPDGKFTMEDWGSGMSHDQLVEYLTVGRSQKKGTLSPVFQRRRKGEFGIGKLSLIKVSEYVVVQTHQGDFDQALRFDDESLITRQAKKVDVPPMVHDGVRLVAVPKDNVKGLFIDYRIKSYIQQNLEEIVEDPTCEVYLNGEHVEPIMVKGFMTPIDVDEYVMGFGRVKGTIEVSREGRIRKEKQGISVTVNGGSVGPRTLFGAESWGHGYSMERITGKIEATFLEPVVRYNREGFDEASREFMGFQETMRKVMANSVRKALDDQKSITLDRLAAEAYKEFMKKLAAVFEKETQYHFDNLEQDDVVQSPMSIPDMKLEETVRQAIESAGGSMTPQEPVHQLQDESSSGVPEPLALSAEPAKDPLDQLSLPQMEGVETPKLILPEGPDVQTKAAANGPRSRLGKMRIKPIMVAGWLVIITETNLDIPALRRDNVIIVNRSYAGFRALATNKEAIFHFIARVVTQEISKVFNEKAADAYDAQNKLLTEVYQTQDE